MQQLFSLVAASLGNNLQVAFSSQNNAKFTHFIFLAFFVRSIFENMITSILIIPDKPSLYRSLKDMLDDGLKIVDHKRPDYVEYFYMLDFQLAGISSYLLNYFILINGNDDVKSRLHYLASPQGEKYAALMSSSSLEEDHYRYSMEVVNSSGQLDVSCNYLEKPLNPNFIFWLSKMTNEHWILETLQRIRDVGLDYAWDNWVKELIMLRRKLKYQKIEQRIIMGRKSDVIDLREIGAICIFCCGMCGLAILSLFTELVMDKWKRPRVLEKDKSAFKIVIRNARMKWQVIRQVQYFSKAFAHSKMFNRCSLNKT